ncbi:MAG: Uma2 family endonuclease [Chloroflexota bacterium]|nr:Uma2 family endonuclease [Chloroflexota bacterium]
MVATQRWTGEVIYPEEDGKVSESDRHYKQAMRLIGALETFFADDPTVFVGGNLFVYYREGDPKQCFSPDVMVVPGVRPRPSAERGSFRVWEEGALPRVIIELTSGSTRRDDILRKPELYAGLGVPEYYLFDPLGEFLRPRLQGYHLTSAGRYEQLLGDEFDSPALGLRLVVHDDWLRLWNPATGTLLPTAEERQAALDATEAALAASEAARLADHAAHIVTEVALNASEAARTAITAALDATAAALDTSEAARAAIAAALEASEAARLADQAEIARLRAALTQPPDPT